MIYNHDQQHRVTCFFFQQHQQPRPLTNSHSLTQSSLELDILSLNKTTVFTPQTQILQGIFTLIHHDAFQHSTWVPLRYGDHGRPHP